MSKGCSPLSLLSIAHIIAAILDNLENNPRWLRSLWKVPGKKFPAKVKVIKASSHRRSRCLTTEIRICHLVIGGDWCFIHDWIVWGTCADLLVVIGIHLSLHKHFLNSSHELRRLSEINSFFPQVLQKIGTNKSKIYNSLKKNIVGENVKILSKHQTRKQLSLGVMGEIWKISKIWERLLYAYFYAYKSLICKGFYMHTFERWLEIHSRQRKSSTFHAHAKAKKCGSVWCGLGLSCAVDLRSSTPGYRRQRSEPVWKHRLGQVLKTPECHFGVGILFFKSVFSRYTCIFTEGFTRLSIEMLKKILNFYYCGYSSDENEAPK